MVLKIILFLVLNFAALAMGGIFTSEGVTSEWYQDLSKAPWTPPGWVFGTAWTFIMICFAVYLSMLWPSDNKRLLLALFIIQWILNVIWNPIFFYFQHISAGLLVIVSLTTLIGFLLYKYWNNLGYSSLLLAPYFIWLLIASSLNAYIFFKN